MYKVDIYGGQDPNTGEWTTHYIWQGGPQTRPLTGRSAMQTGFAVNLSGDYERYSFVQADSSRARGV